MLKDEDQALKVTSAGLRMFERKDQKVELYSALPNLNTLGCLASAQEKIRVMSRIAVLGGSSGHQRTSLWSMSYLNVSGPMS